MILDARELRPGSRLTCDLCVVGAGPAGITLAREFADTGHEVCLLESGGLRLEEPIQSLAEGEIAGRPYARLDACRLRLFGGTTGHWGGYCRRLDRHDFVRRPWIDRSGWPVPADEMTPYYERAEAVCRLPVGRHEADGWRDELAADDLDLSGAPFFHRVSLIRPLQFGRTYREELDEADSVRCYLHATLTDLDPGNGGRAVANARFSTLEGTEFRVEARRYVLACGGIGNARMLLLTGLRRRRALGDGAGLVGRYFMEHPFLRSGTLHLSGDFQHEGSFFDVNSVSGDLKLKGQLGLDPPAQRRGRIGNFLVNVNPHTPPRRGLVDRVLGRLRSLLPGAEDSDPPTRFDLVTTTEQVPNPASRVTLSERRDALGLPRARLEWRLSDIDKRTVREGLEALGRAVGAAGLGRVRIDLPEGPRAWPDRLGWGNHHMGTTRMARTPRRGVVNPDGRVHELDNLYVAGSSVFPTSGCATPTLTLLALTLRLADHLKGELS